MNKIIICSAEKTEPCMVHPNGLIVCMLETTCCTHAPIPKTPSSSSTNLKAHRVRHLAAAAAQQSSAKHCLLIEWEETQFFYRGVEFTKEL